MENRIKELETTVAILESRLLETKKELSEQKLLVQKILGTNVPISEQFDDVEDYFFNKGISFFDGKFFHEN